MRIFIHFSMFRNGWLFVWACWLAVGTESILRGQAISFSSSPEKFLVEARQVFIPVDRDNGKILTERLEKALKAGILNDSDLDKMSAGLNELLRNRMRPFPHLALYIECHLARKQHQVPDGEFEKWDQSIRYILKNKRLTVGGFTDFLENSLQLFTRNVFYKTSSVEWFAGGGGTWVYDWQEGRDPVLRFNALDLVVRSRGDSGVIYKTQGVYDVIGGFWLGKGGQVYWDRAGLPRDKVNARLGRYRIDLKAPTWEADSVLFTHTEYFTKPVFGHLEEKVLAGVTPENALYPKFTSYEKRVKLKNVTPGVDYEGGFSWHGNRLAGTGDPENPSRLMFYRKNQLFLVAASQNFTFRKNQISSDRASITIYLESNGKTDSIYHPGLVFKLLTDKRELSLLREGQGMVQSWYRNSWHDVDMDVQALHWKLDEPFMVLSSIKGSAESKASLRSNFYFRELQYDRLDGIGEISPLYLIKQYCDKHKTRTFTGAEMARHFKDDPSTVRQFLMRLSVAGLANYNVDKDFCEITDRFFHYTNAKARQSDYDIIEFNSITSDENARLSLLDYDMRLYGVRKIYLSDSQSVFVYPKMGELSLRKDMDFHFDGRVESGRLISYGKKFDFLNEKFKIMLDNVDSVRIRVPSREPDEHGQKPLRNVLTVIEKVNAELQIDRPDNKSGLKGLAEYPIYTSKKPSYCFYDRKSIENGVYPRQTFYFQLDPFVIDSLDVFDTEKLALDGTMVSAGIFPDFREKIVIMPDYSLGFLRKTPPEGMPVYDAAGQYDGDISLSHKGLRGKGILKYLASTAHSTDFKWYPDSMNTLAQKFHIERTTGRVEYADVQAEDVYIHWEPIKDKFLVSMTDKPMKMFKGESEMHGTINLTSRGLTGTGRLDMGSAEMRSNQFVFRADVTKADTTSFALKNLDKTSGDLSTMSFTTENVKADVSFTEREGHFISNSSESYINFPINKYIAYMEEMIWYMDKNEVDLHTRKVENIDLKGALFVSTKPGQDSLSFVSPKARFTQSNNTIYGEEVKYIDVADSRIYPDKGKVVIRRDAAMDPLKNARIEMPAQNTRFVIHDADLKVEGKYKISGTGKYTYVDEAGKQNIVNITKIDIDTNKHMLAYGRVNEEDNFTFNPRLSFKGNLLLNSQEDEILFEGASRLNHGCVEVGKQWMKFQARINPKDIYIPVPADPRDEMGRPLFNGFAYAADSSGIYPVMFSFKKTATDQELIRVSGLLRYDSKTNNYKITTREKFANPDLPDAQMVFNAAECTATAEGVLDLGTRMGQVQDRAYGRISYDPKNANTTLDILLLLQFPLDNEFVSLMMEKIMKGEKPSADLKSPELQRFISGLVTDNRRMAKFKEDIQEGTVRKLPDELEKTIVLSGLRLTWDKKRKSLVHNGTASLLALGGKPVLRNVQVKMEFFRRRSGDGFHLYIEPEEGTYYFFAYRNNVMAMVSSSEDFNKKIMEMDPKKRQIEGKEGQPPFTLTPGTQRKAVQFKEELDQDQP
ncbi:MAG: hypothetical protein N2110_00880 [Flavobacteriales bacterium]|nr:hypothetical protein [Flavobacteriales bacterium]